MSIKVSLVTSVSILTTLLLVVPCYAWLPIIFNGRPVDGMIGKLDYPDRSTLPKEHYFEFQRVNHFDGSDARNWKQRYFINETFHETGGPVFLMLGGESEVDPAYIVEGAIVEIARRYKALLVLLEHRYYGKSQPVDDMSPENLQYLSSRQALADVAQFIQQEGQQYSHWGNASIIVFGGGYAGSLAAWSRSKYPYIIAGAVSSSAPLNAYMDFQDYFVGVGDALDRTGPSYKMAVLNATQTMFDWWGQPDKRVHMQNIFRLCHKIDHSALLDLTVFFNNLAQNFALVVQYSQNNRLFQNGIRLNVTIDDVCDVMTDASRGDPIQRYADVNSKILDAFSETCLNIRYRDLAVALNSTNWDSNAAKGARQWLWQSCSEFGWFGSSWSNKQPFGGYFTFPWNYTTDQCIDGFQRIFGGSQVIDNCAETNRFYGGLDLPVSNVLFVVGQTDPWRSVGITTPPRHKPGVELVQIEGGSFCSDIYPSTPQDPKPLVHAREKISDIIKTWIRDNL